MTPLEEDRQNRRARLVYDLKHRPDSAPAQTVRVVCVLVTYFVVACAVIWGIGKFFTMLAFLA